MSLIKNMVKEDSEVWVPTPIEDDFQIKLRFASKDRITKMQEQASKKFFNPKTGQQEVEVDDKKFLNKFLEHCLVDWSGFSYRVLSLMAPVDETQIPEDEWNEEIPFSIETAKDLMDVEAVGFDGWLFSAVRDVQNFTKSR